MNRRTVGRQPKYQRIAADLKAAIAAGTYTPGQRIPGENDLMATYEVARMTARQALATLRSEGLIEARKGAGIFVRQYEVVIRRRGVQRLSLNLWAQGKSVWSADIDDRSLEVDSVSVMEEPAPKGVAATLDTPAEAPVCVRRRRFLLDGRPVLFATSYLDAELVAGTAITQPDTGPGGIYARLDEIGHKPVHFREEIRSRMPNAEETAGLGLTPGTPVTLICRTAFAEDGRAVEVNDMVLDSSAYVLEYEFDA
ncbi:GntR family transcriptional regulator [Streptomyces cavernicola]|uniref:GntR family transcriptional regulator n=1 Tax=Streptomyces cavernicola TaxID=3043613 RepID=A0ABT6SLP4_9ACTN|nr:GntR family transcriptional regulator [Streptomyces sp. B-S-A6]MDI3409112.1 GntR family transcriptional regulator [Streptomyces sp. B-S-A6]